LSNGPEHTGSVRDIPREMQIGRRGVELRARIRVPAAGRALPRKLETFLTHRAPVEEELDDFTVRERDDRDELSLSTSPVPVRKEMQYRACGPLAVIEVEC